MPNHIVRRNGIPEHSPTCDCLDCHTAWEDWHEAKYALRLLDRDVELRQAKLASDAEWAEFMDTEFPRVKEGVAP